MKFTLSINGLYVGYRKKQVINNLSINMNSKELICLTGPNGGGKTTLMQSIAGIIPIQKGTCSWTNHPHKPMNTLLEARDVWYIGNHGEAFEDLTVKENLDFVSMLQGVPSFDIPNRSFALMQTWELIEYKDTIVIDLSNGLRKRLALAFCLLKLRPVILLDEPLNGLDLIGTEILIDILSFLKNKGILLVIASHIVEPLEYIVDKWGWLEFGFLDLDQDKIKSRIKSANSLNHTEKLTWLR